MIQSKLIAIASMIAVAATAGTASGDLVAGWDFSQYRNPGFLTIDGTTFEDTLGANYSHLAAGLVIAGQPQNGVGPLASQFGKLFFDGTEGSTNINEIPPNADVVPIGRVRGSRRGAIRSNLIPLKILGRNSFNAFRALKARGQRNGHNLSMAAIDGTNDLVFRAASGVDATDWELSFGARTIVGTATVSVDYDPACSENWIPASPASVAVDGDDEKYEFDLGAASDWRQCVRVRMPTVSGRPVIDNVAIVATTVPEPATAVLFVAGAMGLAALSRTRRS